MTRKRQSTKKRTMRRMRGGTCRIDESPIAVSSCGPLRSYKNKNPLFRHYSVVPVLEDCIKIAGPGQKLCFGNTITSCIAVAIVMENNWKIGAHINPLTNMYIEAQDLNPLTLLSSIESILQENPHFSGSIKAIYIYGESDVFELSRDSTTRKYSRINNTNSRATRESQLFGSTLSLYSARKEDIVRAFNTIFANKITPNTIIRINPTLELQSMKGHHFLVNEDGSLDLLGYRRIDDRIL